jgi:hypothetical protein
MASSDALACWALHRLEQTRDASWVEVVNVFVPWLSCGLVPSESH